MAKKSAEPTSPLKSFIGDNTKVTVTIAWEKVAPAYEKAKQKVARKLKADGFRPGKVPAELAEQLAGRERIVEETLQLVLPEAYNAVIEKEKKQPLTYPEFNPLKVENTQDWVVEAFLAERPTLTVKDYKKVAQTAIKEADKKIAETEKEQEKAHKEGKHADDHDHKITDEQRNDYRLQHIYQAMVQEYKPVIPELLVKHEVQADLDQLTRQLSQVNLTFDDYVQRRGQNFEQISQEMTINALGKLQVAFLMDAVAQQANLTLDDKELDEYIEKKVDEKSKKQFGNNPEYRRLLANTLLRQKIADHLLAA